MLIIRPINIDDLDHLMELLRGSAHGLTSLPLDREVLERRIRHSEGSFNHNYLYQPGGELYLFVMEDTEAKKIVGVSGIMSKIGGFEPFYFYRLEKQTKHSTLLDVDSEVTAMHVHKVYNGPAEICSLYLGKDFRNSQNGRFLSLSRFLYMANNINLFETKVIAEMRGQVEDNGYSPFWESVGKKFFKISFLEADFLTMKNKVFIEELLPTYPIILELLPEEAQSVVGKVHKNTEPALHILKKEGFNISNLVGIFEPGPVISAEVSNIRTVKDSQCLQVTHIKKLENTNDQDIKIISNLSKNDFRAALSQVIVEQEAVTIDTQVADQLQVSIGDTIRCVNLRPS